MPRKPKGLPYVRRKSSGSLEYCRRVPVELRGQLNNRVYFTKVIGQSGVSQQDPELITRWTEANQEYERLIEGARSAITPASTDVLPRMPIAPRDAAGLGAAPWRSLLNSLDAGQLTPDTAELLPNIAAQALYLATLLQQTGDIAAVEAGQAQIAEQLLQPTLDSVGIAPDPASSALIQQRLWGYLQDFKADLLKRSDGDYSTGQLEQKAPPPPKKKVTYADLLEAWRLNTGGIREVDGIGVTAKRIKEYEGVSAELTQLIGKQFPDDVTVADARAYTQHIQQTSLSPSTKQRRISSIRFLFQLGVKYGYLDANVFRDMTISIPKGGESEGYLPFDKKQLRIIFRELKTRTDTQRHWLPLLLLCTGSRLSEMMLLRHTDIKKTKRGIWYFDLVHEPTGDYPHPLKQGRANVRQVPMHPLLIKRKFLSIVEPHKQGYIFPGEKNDLVSQWFKLILQRHHLWKPRTTGLHSLRGTWIDLLREARVPEDIRRACVGHSGVGSHDQSYGLNLRQSPDLLYEEIAKVDLSWLP